MIAHRAAFCNCSPLHAAPRAAPRPAPAHQNRGTRKGEGNALTSPLSEYERETPLMSSHTHRPVRAHHFRERTLVIPAKTFVNCIPFVNRSLKLHRCQAPAIKEGHPSYARHAVRDGDGRQAAATRESTITYARHAVRDGDGRQADAAGEGGITYASHAVRDGNGRQAGAIPKGRTPYAHHAVWNSDGRQAGAIPKGRTPNASHAVRDGNGRQAGTAIEGRTMYKSCLFTYNARGDRRVFRFHQNEIRVCFVPEIICVVVLIVFQIIAAIKGFLPYARHTVRDGDERQAAATRESTNSYARHTVRNGDGRQATATRERTITYVRHAAVVRYYACIATSSQRLAFGFYQAISIAMIYWISFFDNNRRQGAATLESNNSYARHAVRDGNGCQAGAPQKGTIAYARHAVRDGHGRQASATLESTNSYARHAVRDGDGRQAGTTGESIISYTVTARQHHCLQIVLRNRANRTCWHSGGSDVAAILEGSIPYVSHAVRNGHGCQASATIEGIIPYTFHAVRNSHGRQTGARLEGRTIYKFCLFTYNARSDGSIFRFHQNEIRVCFVPEIICVVVFIVP